MLGSVDQQPELLDADAVCGHLVAEGSIYRTLADLGDRLFSDEDFADLYVRDRGRHSVPPSLVATVQLLQSLEGLSDRDAVEHLRCDLRWKVALRLSLTDEGFHPTVLCYFRERLRRSDAPRRIFDRFKQVAGEAGLLSRRGTRILDSTPVLSAVQTQDTVTMIRSGMRRVLSLVDAATAARLRPMLSRDDYDDSGKPVIDWDSELARAGLVDQLVCDAFQILVALEGKALSGEVREAVELLSVVIGQDIDTGEDGTFRIRRGVAADRVISTVDPEARHGRKSSRGSFDGYKAHVAVDPDTELICEVEVTPANEHDASVVDQLLPELAPPTDDALPADHSIGIGDEQTQPPDRPPSAEEATAVTVIADTAYGSGVTRQALIDAGATPVIKAPPDVNSTGGFPKSAFTIDLDAATATCPAGHTTTMRPMLNGGGIFLFGAQLCSGCPLRDRCTISTTGRKVAVGPYERQLAQARRDQTRPEFTHIYRSTRPTVERVIARLVRRGGRKAKYRGTERVREQIRLKAAAENLLRMIRLGLNWRPQTGWAAT